MDAVSLLVKRKNLSQFSLKLGKEFNDVAQEYALSDLELFSKIFDHVLSATGLEATHGVKLVATVKYPEPRVTLLLVRKHAREDIAIFKQNFVAQAVHYLTCKQSQKQLELIMSVERVNC